MVTVSVQPGLIQYRFDTDPLAVFSSSESTECISSWRVAGTAA